MKTYQPIIAIVMLTTITACTETSAQTERVAESIRSAVREHTPEITACYDELLTSDPEAAGTVVVRFAVDNLGDVIDSSIESSEIDSPELEACMLSAISSLSFPEIDGQGVSTVSYPFTFRPRADATTWDNRLTRESIREVFSGAQRDIQRCFETGLAQDSELEGRVTVRVTINEDGTISELNLEDSTLDSAVVTACLEDRLSTLVFPAHDDGAMVVNYPLYFASNR